MVWRPVEFKATSRFDLDGNSLPCGEAEHCVEILGVFTDKSVAETVREHNEPASVMYIKLDEATDILLDATFPKGTRA
jgi:hypothetical protein